MTENYQGQADQFSGRSDFAAIEFLVRQVLAGLATAALVQIKAVYPADGPNGRVDVQPLAGQVDGKGNVVPHGTIFGLPYFQLQGGVSAVLTTPAVGDIGAAVFASRDISTVKATRAPSPPGSARQFDWSDGLYLGGFLNLAPTQYLRFGGGVDIVSPLVAASRSLSAGNGATGSFTTPAGQVVTVMSGIVVSIE